jgi:CRP/FNR family cyclic AMP-dependent transcriptional regulator
LVRAEPSGGPARARSSSRRAREGQVIFSQSDPADALFYIRKGKVKVTTLSSHGKEAVVAILGAGDFFGEGCLAGQPLRISTVAAMVDSSVARLDKAAVVRVLHEEPAFSELFGWAAASS